MPAKRRLIGPDSSPGPFGFRLHQQRGAKYRDGLASQAHAIAFQPHPHHPAARGRLVGHKFRLVQARAPEWSQAAVRRSEEHTSELQSPDHLVCRLLLEKKKKPREMQKTLSIVARRSRYSH